jgi:hypothetical protein
MTMPLAKRDGTRERNDASGRRQMTKGQIAMTAAMDLPQSSRSGVDQGQSKAARAMNYIPENKTPSTKGVLAMIGALRAAELMSTDRQQLSNHPADKGIRRYHREYNL